MKSYRTLWKYLKQYRWRLITGLAALLIVDLFQLVIPRIVKTAVDDLTAMTATFRSLAMAGLLIVGLAVAIGALRYLWRLLILGFSRLVEEDMRLRLYEKILGLSPSWFLTRSTGDIMARATNDLEAVRMAAGMGLVALVDAVLMGAASIGFMAWISTRLTLLALVPMPLITVLSRYLSAIMYRRYRDVQNTFGRMTGQVRDYLDGIRVVQAHVKEDLALEDLEDIGQGYVRENIRLNKVSGAFFPLMLMFTNLSLAIVLYYGGRMTIFAAISTGDFVAFISYLGLLTWPLMAMGWVVNLIQRGAASLDRINRVLDAEPEIKDPDDPADPGLIRGGVDIRSLTFSYPGRTEKVLDGLTASFPAGQTTALVGRTGSGKSTLLNMIPRMFSPPEGTVYIDGTNIERFRLRDLRGAIGYVPQDGYIFSGTIAENIAFGDPDASREKILDAARAAMLDDDIESFRKGYEAFIGERGVTLSGGQKQRLALARALLLDPPLLILDDTLSAVDAAVEERILANIARIRAGKTTIIVSHRLTSLKIADRIHVLEHGRITASGSHDDLVNQDGYYAHLHHLQSIQAVYHSSGQPAAS